MVKDRGLGCYKVSSQGINDNKNVVIYIFNYELQLLNLSAISLDKIHRMVQNQPIYIIWLGFCRPILPPNNSLHLVCRLYITRVRRQPTCVQGWKWNKQSVTTAETTSCSKAIENHQFQLLWNSSSCVCLFCCKVYWCMINKSRAKEQNESWIAKKICKRFKIWLRPWSSFKVSLQGLILNFFYSCSR